MANKEPNLKNRKAQVGLEKIVVNVKNNWQLYVMFLLPLAYILIFHYGPMYGLQIAFKDYKVKLGITGSPWVGLKHFRKFFTSYKFSELLSNTLGLTLYNLFVGFPIPIILALFIHVCNHKFLKKLTQNISYIPHFISVAVLIGIAGQMLNPVSGFYGTVYRAFGGEGYPADLRINPTFFRDEYVWTGVWQNMGWDTIIYVSALCGVSPELHEAAEIDGASRWKRVLHVDIPAILPTICILLILRCGKVMALGYEKIYLLQNDVNLSKSEVISTYVYKIGLGKQQFSFATAVGLFNSVVNSVILVVVNFITRKVSNGEKGLF